MNVLKQGLLLGALLLGGCVSYSTGDLAPVGTWPPAASSEAAKPSAYLRTTALYQVNDNPATAAAGAHAQMWEKAISETYQESGRFTQVSTRKVESDLYAESTLTNHEQFVMASAFITGFTFFIIPSTAKNTFTLQTVFKDKEGKEVGRISKSESVRTWMQLVLIVGLPFQADTRDVVRELARSTLDEAVQRKLL
ncbi:MULTISPECIES: hypothetical protein [Pseudomonas]|uniref:Lipoprotein n=2 Tax=Pseudomonas TaxID=286 RepID=A0ABM7CT29_9PSED|nr:MULTISPECIES: hypothetical protein [Pseudomonas]AZL69509.1 hypothetical protein EJA05_18105 [Pseudomonas oryziphila]AZL74632.1 hypothetical protein EI693_16750 [Pseudomonas oryziphila]UVK81379.1 hypothetical protein LOY46_17620 [Pseudomonas sichuanensis]UVL87566.1 hypothetical protein LOY51_17475 [Pseudomonas sichuanensis]